MKMLKKLALVSAVAAVSSTSFALEQLDDDTLAQTTGQDGITITISPDKTTGLRIDDLLVHDNDGVKAADFTATTSKFTAADLGLTAAKAGSAGALVIAEGAKKWDATNKKWVSGDTTVSGTTTSYGMIIKGGDIAIKVDTDGGGTGSDAFVNANIKMSGTTDIGIGKIQVAKSKATTATSTYTGKSQRGLAAGATAKDVLGALSLKMNGGEMNVQLGAQPQGAMVKMKSTLTGGLELANLEVIDSDGYSRPEDTSVTPKVDAITGSKGSLLVKKLVMTDNDSTGNLSMNAQVDIDSKKGIVIEMASPTNGYYAYMTDVGIGNGAGTGTFANVGTDTANNIIGDVEIVGLHMGKSTISISGH